MTFWEHLDELRKVLFRSAVLVIALMVVIFSAKDFIFDNIVFAPTTDAFPLYRGLNWVLAELGAEPLAPFSIDLINIELSAQFFIHISTSFYFALVLATPFVLYQLGTYQVSQAVANQISLQSYISMFVWMILVMGIVFEMPSAAAILNRLGVLKREFLKRYRKHAFVILLIVAAVITPSGDPFTLLAVGLPLYTLYELSILVCRRDDINK